MMQRLPAARFMKRVGDFLQSKNQEREKRKEERGRKGPFGFLFPLAKDALNCIRIGKPLTGFDFLPQLRITPL